MYYFAHLFFGDYIFRIKNCKILMQKIIIKSKMKTEFQIKSKPAEKFNNRIKTLSTFEPVDAIQSDFNSYKQTYAKQNITQLNGNQIIRNI